MVGEVSKALGALLAGWATHTAAASGVERLLALRLPIYLFGGLSVCKAALYAACSPRIEAVTFVTPVTSVTRIEAAGSRGAPTEPGNGSGGNGSGGDGSGSDGSGNDGGVNSLLGRLPCAASLSPDSRQIVLQLSALFAVDAFAGGFIMLSWTGHS